MAGKYFGFELDVHGGGADLAFPHHENERAQSEAFSGKTFARYWLHNGFITVGKSDDGDDVKMGKSKGNAFRLREAFRLAPPAALRLWILGTHYRMPLLYRPEFLTQAAAGLDRIYNAIEALERAIGETPTLPGGALAESAAAADRRFRAAMDDDANTPVALAVLHDWVGQANTAVKDGAPSAGLTACLLAMRSFLGVLGLPLSRPDGGGGADADGYIRLLVDIRAEARKAKDFATSDRVRDGLKALGVELNDRGGETTWNRRCAGAE